jgi:cardiolipin synthase
LRYENNNGDITLLVNGNNAFPEIIKSIENAKESIYINMFIWRDDEIGNRIAAAVLGAADRGVKVNISVDRYGVVLEKSEEAEKSFFHKKQLLSEKIKIASLKMLYPENCCHRRMRDEYTELYNNIVNHTNITVSADGFKADHSKYYIIDGEVLFLGGINIEDKENGCDISGRVYGDYMAKLCGKNYVDAFKKKLQTGENFLDGIFFGINVKLPARRFEMEELYLNMIADAKTELHITMAYFSPIKEFIDAILKAHERGVRVTLVVPEKANFQNDSNRRTVRELLRASKGGIEVYFSPKMLHTKLVVNDSMISFGSTNITKKAFGQLDELNLFLKNNECDFKRALYKSIADDIGASQRVYDYKKVRYNRLLAFFEGFLV